MVTCTSHSCDCVNVLTSVSWNQTCKLFCCRTQQTTWAQKIRKFRRKGYWTWIFRVELNFVSVFKIISGVAVLLDLAVALFCLWGGIYGSLFPQVPVQKSYRWGESSMPLPQWLFIPNKTPMILMVPLMEECRLTWVRRELKRSLDPKSCSQQDCLQSQIGLFMALGVSCQLFSTVVWGLRREMKWLELC